MRRRIDERSVIIEHREYIKCGGGNNSESESAGAETHAFILHTVMHKFAEDVIAQCADKFTATFYFAV